MAGTIDVGNLRTTWTGDTDDVQDSTRQASAVVKQSFEKIKSAGKLVTSTFDKVKDFGKRAGESLGDLEISVEDLFSAYGTLKDNFDQGSDLAELGAASLRVEDRFGKFAQAAGGADTIMAAFQKGVGGTASEMDAMSISSGLLQAGLVGNASEMEKVTEVASRLGDQTIGVSSRIDSFSQLLKNQSIQLLDNFGISSGKVKERIKELQAETAGMSREQAFLTATFEQADAALQVLGPRTTDHLTAMEKQAAAAANLEVEIGQKLAPAYAKLADFQANMSTETAIAIKGFQTSFTTAVQLSGGIDKLAVNFGKLASKMGTSTAALGGLGVAVGALILVNDRLQQQLDKMADAQDNAKEAAGGLGDQVQALVDDGATLEEAMTKVGAKVNKAGEEFNDARVFGVIPLKNAFNASAKFSDAMAESSKALNKTISLNTGSFEEYEKQVKLYNAGITNADAKIELMTKSQFKLNRIMVEGASDLSLMSDQILQQKLAMTEAVEETETLTLAQQENLRTIDMMSSAQERAAQRSGEMNDITEQLSAQIETADARTQTLSDRTEQLAESQGRAGGAVSGLGEQLEKQTFLADVAAQRIDAQAQSALRSAEALAIEKQAAQDLAVETGNLSIALKDATEADIARRFIGMLDPKKLGAEAYTKAITDIGLKSGIMDETSVRLAKDMTTLAIAVNENIIPVDDVSAAMDEMSKNAETAGEPVENLIAQFENAPATIRPVGDALDRAGAGMAAINAEGGNASLLIDSFGDSTEKATPKLKGFQDKLDATEDNLLTLVDGSPWVVTVTASGDGGGGGGGVGGDDPDFSGGQSFAGGAGGGVNVEEMTVNVQVADASEVVETFEETMAWAGRSG